MQLLEKLAAMQDVAHVHRKMMLEQDWAEYERLQAERKAKQASGQGSRVLIIRQWVLGFRLLVSNSDDRKLFPQMLE